jgi:hypothetical protein
VFVNIKGRTMPGQLTGFGLDEKSILFGVKTFVIPFIFQVCRRNGGGYHLLLRKSGKSAGQGLQIGAPNGTNGQACR